MNNEEAKTILSNAMSLLDIESGFHDVTVLHHNCMASKNYCDKCQEHHDTWVELSFTRGLLGGVIDTGHPSALVEAILLSAKDHAEINEEGVA